MTSHLNSNLFDMLIRRMKKAKKRERKQTWKIGMTSWMTEINREELEGGGDGHSASELEEEEKDPTSGHEDESDPSHTLSETPILNSAGERRGRLCPSIQNMFSFTKRTVLESLLIE